MSERDLIWVPKELAVKYNALESVNSQEEMVKTIIERKGLDIKSDLEQLDENVLVFKAACVMHKKALENAYEEQEEKIYQLWKDMGDISSSVSVHAKELAAMISPISESLQDMRKQITALKKNITDTSLYIPQQLVDLASVVGRMDDKTKEILRALLIKQGTIKPETETPEGE